MKSKLLLFVVIAVALFGTSAMAQQDPLDEGNADTVALVLTVDTTGLTAELETWVYSDELLNGATFGMTWGDSPTTHFTLDSAISTPAIDAGFDLGRFFYEASDINLTNTNQRYLFGGTALFSGGFAADAGARRLWATYYFTISQWDGWNADGILIDTLMFDGGSEYLFVGAGNVNFIPLFEGAVFFGDPSLSTDEPVNTRPETYALNQNYPNPFNPTTEIAFDLPNKTDVKLSIFNILGQKVATLVDKNNFTETRKMMLLK